MKQRARSIANPIHHTWLALLAIAATLLIVCITTGSQPSQAQAQQPPALETPTAIESPDAAIRLLPNALPLGNPISAQIQAESIAIAPIYLDGRTLFQLGAPVVESATNQLANEPNAAEIRAQEIQPRLYRIAQQQLKSPTTVSVKVDQASQLPIISVGDEHLLTVTNLDAQQNGYVDRNEYAIDLQATIKTGLERYRLERQPEFLQQQTKMAIAIIAAALLLFWGSQKIEKKLRARQTRLVNTNTRLGKATAGTQPPLAALTPSTNVANGNRVDAVFALLKAKLDNRQKRKINEFATGLLLLTQIGMLGGSILWVLWLFPHSRWLTTLLRYWISVPAKILLIAGLAYLAIRIVSLVVDKLFLALQEGAQWAPEQWADELSERLHLRLLTFSQVTKGIAGSVIFGFMILAMLSTAGIEIGPILAGAGIIGVGISLAAQSLIKDIINGFLILLEDQFGVGDVIAVGDISGSVEAINLRTTRLRNTEGRLITIPNSQISIVQNLSKDWSQVDLSVSVEPSTNINEAIAVMKDTAIALAKDPNWQKFILEPPDLLGVEALDSTGITLRLLLKTQPLKQWAVARELRAQLKRAFDQAGISTGVPQERLEIRWNDFASNQPPLPQTPPATSAATSAESHPQGTPT